MLTSLFLVSRLQYRHFLHSGVYFPVRSPPLITVIATFVCWLLCYWLPYDYNTCISYIYALTSLFLILLWSQLLLYLWLYFPVLGSRTITILSFLTFVRWLLCSWLPYDYNTKFLTFVRWFSYSHHVLGLWSQFIYLCVLTSLFRVVHGSHYLFTYSYFVLIYLTSLSQLTQLCDPILVTFVCWLTFSEFSMD